jgi:hypothetical protein
MAEIGIMLPVEKAHALLNRSPAFLGEGDCELDHVGRLGIAQLGVVALIRIDLQNVDRHVDRLLADHLGHLDHRDSNHAGDTILVLEVLRDRDLLGPVIWIGEGGLGGVHVDEFIDGPKAQS